MASCLVLALALACEPAAGPEPPKAAKPAPAPRRAYRHVGASPLDGLELEAAAAHVADAFATQVNPFYALGATLHGNGPIEVTFDGSYFDDPVDTAHTFDDPMRLLDCLKDPAITRSSWGPTRRFGASCEAPERIASILDTPRRFNATTIAACEPTGDTRCCTLEEPQVPPGSLMLERVCMSRRAGARWKIARLETYGRW